MTKRRARGSGSLTLKGKIWHMRYIDPSGKRVSESTGKTKKTEAQDVLKSRLAEVVEGRYKKPETRNFEYRQLAVIITNYYYGERTEPRAKIAVEHHKEFFGDRHPVVDITYDRLDAYRTHRREQGMCDGTIKFELAILRRGLKQALKAGKVVHIPPFPEIRIDDARQEFITDGEFEALKAELPGHQKPLVEFAFWTGWRMQSEILPLKWHQVDFDRGVVRLEPGTTKNKKGREFPFDVLPQLEGLLKAQRAHTDEVEHKTGQVIPNVFHRNGKPFTYIKTAFKSACRRAKVLGADGKPKHPHDFRRAAVRRLERAGVPRSVAMKLVGYTTQTMYDRYAISNEGDLREGLAKVAAMPKGAAHNVHPIDIRHRKGTKSA